MRIPRRLRGLTVPSFAVVVALSLAASACRTDAGSSPADEGAISVVAVSLTQAFAAARVGGPEVAVTNLTPPSVEPHDLELTPDDLEAIATADVVVYLGGGFQPAVEEAVEAEAGGVTVDALEGLDPLPPPEDDHADEEEAEHDDEELAADPHVWLDPIVFAGVVDRVAAAMGEADPAAKATYAEGAATLTDELEILDREFTEGLAECDTRVAITNHAAFGYLADAYDLRQEAISGLSPESEPDPARLAELAEEARADGVTTIFTEELVAPDVAETLAAEAGLETAVLNPLEGLTDDQAAAGEDYVTVMRRNLETLRAGLVCT